jgi:hypothetical protein
MAGLSSALIVRRIFSPCNRAAMALSRNLKNAARNGVWIVTRALIDVFLQHHLSHLFTTEMIKVREREMTELRS